MTFGFDLDGTLDNPYIAEILFALVDAGHEVHIISGVFDEAGDWQTEEAKREKLVRLAIPDGVKVHFLHALPHEKFDRDYRLADLGLRKGATCEEWGIQLFIDDSEQYCNLIPKFSGGTTVLQVK